MYSTACYEMRKIRCREVYAGTTLSPKKQNKILKLLHMFVYDYLRMENKVWGSIPGVMG